MTKDQQLKHHDAHDMCELIMPQTEMSAQAHLSGDGPGLCPSWECVPPCWNNARAPNSDFQARKAGLQVHGITQIPHRLGQGLLHNTSQLNSHAASKGERTHHCDLDRTQLKAAPLLVSWLVCVWA